VRGIAEIASEALRVIEVKEVKSVLRSA